MNISKAKLEEVITDYIGMGMPQTVAALKSIKGCLLDDDNSTTPDGCGCSVDLGTNGEVIGRKYCLTHSEVFKDQKKVLYPVADINPGHTITVDAKAGESSLSFVTQSFIEEHARYKKALEEIGLTGCACDKCKIARTALGKEIL